MGRGRQETAEDPLRRQRLAATDGDDDHAVSELAADRTGALSPFGDLTFPLPSEDLPYTHPVTVVNR